MIHLVSCGQLAAGMWTGFLYSSGNEKAGGASRTDQIYLISDLTVKLFLRYIFRRNCAEVPPPRAYFGR